MQRSRILSALLLALFAVGIVLADEAKTPAKLHGDWVPVEAELGGQAFPAEVLSTMKLTMGDGVYEVHVGEQADKGTYTVDTESKPMAMDITGVEGPNQGKTIPAIYEFDGDTMRVCYDLSSTERPKGFETAQGTLLFLVKFERVVEKSE